MYYKSIHLLVSATDLCHGVSVFYLTFTIRPVCVFLDNPICWFLVDCIVEFYQHGAIILVCTVGLVLVLPLLTAIWKTLVILCVFAGALSLSVMREFRDALMNAGEGGGFFGALSKLYAIMTVFSRAIPQASQAASEYYVEPMDFVATLSSWNPGWDLRAYCAILLLVIVIRRPLFLIRDQYKACDVGLQCLPDVLYLAPPMHELAAILRTRKCEMSGGPAVAAAAEYLKVCRTKYPCFWKTDGIFQMFDDWERSIMHYRLAYSVSTRPSTFPTFPI